MAERRRSTGGKGGPAGKGGSRGKGGPAGKGRSRGKGGARGEEGAPAKGGSSWRGGKRGGEGAAAHEAGDRPRGKGRPRAAAERQGGDVDPRLDPERSVYGRHPVREALRGPREVFAVYATVAALDELRSEIPPGVSVHERDGASLELLVGTSDHQGVVADVAPFRYCQVEDLLAGDEPVVFCLDQITDPHNLGAIARVCDASGASGLLIPEHRSARVSATVCKTSAGAIEHVPVAICTNLADTIARVKGAAVWAYGASEHGERLYTDVEYSGGVMLVLGSEGAGIRPRVREMCDELVQVPMLGHVSSLNVSTVAALLGYEVVRQRGTGDEPGAADDG